MTHSPLMQQLSQALRCIPGVGQKSAQRTAYYLLERDRDGAKKLADILNQALESIQHCQSCRMPTESQLCQYCKTNSRDKQTLCIVEMPVDVDAIEQTGEYRGHYFVLLGKLSPIDGIGPNDLGFDLLKQKIANQAIEEIIIATNPTVEGEITAHYIANLVKDIKDIKVTRIAHGIPMGAELEYTDGSTLAFAISQRRELS